MLKPNKIYCGDCQTVMRDIDSNSIDGIITDPPYGLSFMGKDWDKAVPSVAIWQECLRVLKPGAFAFVMCIPRQDCLARMICRLEDAGFNVAFSSIYWTYASGFPKAQNISKQIDKQAKVEREVVGEYQHPDGKKRNWKDHKNASSTLYKMGMPTDSNSRDVTAPATPQAKALDGAYGGFQPKPAVEVVIVAMKPLEERTYMDQALKNGHGCTWLDDCRIPYESERDVGNKHRFTKAYSQGEGHEGWKRKAHDTYTPPIVGHNKGRFPANVICEDNVLDDGIKRKTGDVKPHSRIPSLFCACNEDTSNHKGDTGSFSRYFSLDAWFAERITLLPIEVQKTFPWLIVPKASKSEKNRGLNEGTKTIPYAEYRKNYKTTTSWVSEYPNGKSRPMNTAHNNHPTCKPLKLMSWLITLGSREGNIILDPFCGSGTTAIAAKMLGRQYLGIEKEEEYCEIARKRLSIVTEGLSKWA